MISALWNGVSGITSYEKGIGVQSNNIANANSLAFKQDEITFEDLIYANDGAGKGVKYQDISKDFSQGNLNPTNSNIDVAIDGKGFFVAKDLAGNLFYTRAGNFIQSEDGFLKTQNNLSVMGLASQKQKITSTLESDVIFTDDYKKNLSSITINSNNIAYNINAKATNYINSAKSDPVVNSGNNYKTSGSKISDVEATLSDYNEKLKLFQSNPSQSKVIDYSSILSKLQKEGDFISIKIDGKELKQEAQMTKDPSDPNKNIVDINATLSKLSKQINALDGFSSKAYTNGFFIIENSRLFEVSDGIINSIENKANIRDSETSNQISSVDYSKVMGDLQKENDFISVTIDDNVIRQNFDTDVQTTLKKLSDKISNLQGFTSNVDATTGIFTIKNLLVGKDFKVSDAIVNNNTSISKVDIKTKQNAEQGQGLAMIDSARDALKSALETANAKFLEIRTQLDYGKAEFANSAINVNLNNLAFVKDAKGDISISDDGFVFLSLEGSQYLVGKIGTATFVNEDGLIPQGENLYASSKESGVAINGDAYNTIQSKFLENSNVNMGNSLTMLMVYQRAFEANSKSITTSDEMLKQAMDMKK